MTQDPQVILKGLLCCSRTNPDCENCPFTEKEVHCRELESDAATLIQSLLSEINDLEGLNDRLLNDIDTKLAYIEELEERVGMSRG